MAPSHNYMYNKRVVFSALLQRTTMADEISPSHLRELGSGSPLRVAFDLMVHIAKHEIDEDEVIPPGEDDSKKYRDYWLALFLQCRKATTPSIPKLNDVLNQCD